MKIFNKKKRGFTLIEMVVVIAIIVIIASVTIPQALKAVNKARASTDIANARTYASEITSKLADGTIKFEDVEDKSSELVLKDNQPKGFGITPVSPKLVEGEFCYKYSVDKNGNEVIEVGVKKDKGDVIIIYPGVQVKSEYEKYIKSSI